MTNKEKDNKLNLLIEVNHKLDIIRNGIINMLSASMTLDIKLEQTTLNKLAINISELTDISTELFNSTMKKKEDSNV